MKLKDKIESLSGVGVKRKSEYLKLKIKTIYDLLTYFPKGYENTKHIVIVKEMENEEKGSIRLKILDKKFMKISRNRVVFKFISQDEFKNFIELIYFNNTYINDKLNIGDVYYFYGKITKDFYSVKMTNPLVLNELGLIPKYYLTKGITKNILVRHIVKAFKSVENFDDGVPKKLIVKYKLLDFKTALYYIHFPKTQEQYLKARNRLVFEEFLYWQVGLLRLRKYNSRQTTNVLKDVNLDPFLKELPFSLTAAQKRVIDECVLDCKNKKPMNRLIQGDVGSGKTVVAAAVAYLFAKEKKMVALMVPTEILARQHYKTFCSFLEKFSIRVSLLVGNLKKKEREKILDDIKTANTDIVIGTHALFYDAVIFHNLSLIITDEQHRFGVKQREKLNNKSKNAHLLVMSATPIPRTLALIFYGDLEISTIDESPPGRIETQTVWISSKKRSRAFEFIKKEIKKKRQAYFICPAIEQGENALSNVLDYVKLLKKCGFTEEKIGLLHGKMKSEEKNDVMKKFSDNEISVLVSTTVVEVGVDVANANVIVIENAEMFGLAQLHQLRGRVGRGKIKSFCILISDSKTQENKNRMKAVCETSDGFELAKKDLSLRGPGDF